jgi:hypothetical protein
MTSAHIFTRRDTVQHYIYAHGFLNTCGTLDLDQTSVLYTEHKVNFAF